MGACHTTQLNKIDAIEDTSSASSSLICSSYRSWIKDRSIGLSNYNEVHFLVNWIVITVLIM